MAKKDKIEINVKKEILVKGCELSFHHLADKQTSGPFPSNAYTCDVYIKKTEAKEKLTELLTEIQKAGEQIHGKKLAWKQCTEGIVDMDESLSEDDEYRQYKEGKLRLRCKSKNIKPIVMNAKKQVMSNDEIRNLKMGDTVNVLVNIYPWEATKEITTVVDGVEKKAKVKVKKVSLGLIGVQYVKSGGFDNTALAAAHFTEEASDDLVEGGVDSGEELGVDF